MKALVIGGNGFIGSNLVSLLLKNKHQVRIFDRYPNRFLPPSSEVENVMGDFSNHGEIAEAVKGIDWVFHLAYTTLPRLPTTIRFMTFALISPTPCSFYRNV